MKSIINPARMCISSALLLVFVGGAFAAEAAKKSEVKQEHHKHAFVVYFNPSDREAVPGYQGRINRILKTVQDWYRDEMKRNGYGPMTFPVERDENGDVVVHFVKAPRSWKYGEEALWSDVRDNYVKPAMLKEGIDIDNEHIFIFQNLCFIEDMKMNAWCWYAGSGTAKSGTAWLTDNEYADAANMQKIEPKVNDAGREIPLYSYVSSQLGGVAHEFGHALGLPHNKETSDEFKELGRALMGNGNHFFLREIMPKHEKGAFLSKSHAKILASHPLFKRHAKDVDVEPKVVFDDLKATCDKNVITITGRVTTNLKPWAIVAYNDISTIPNDYDATSWLTTDLGKNGEFSIEIEDARVGPFELRLKCYLENGAMEQIAFRYELDESLRLPADSFARQFIYQRFVESAYARRDVSALKAAISKLGDKDDLLSRRAKGLQHILATPPVELIPLTAVKDDVKSVSLASIQWETAKVGWLKPTVNFIPKELLPFESATDVFAEGIYGHANSSYVYKLGGNWKTFESQYCLQNLALGSVEFVVKCDGVEKFRSGIIDHWDAGRLKVNVSGVDTLELIVEDAGDGISADCGNWLVPTLKR